MNASQQQTELKQAMMAIKPLAIDVLPSSGQEIIDTVCMALEINPIDVATTCKANPLSDVRKIICFHLRTKLDMTYKEIGILLNRDHSTILEAVKTYHSLIDMCISGKVASSFRAKMAARLSTGSGRECSGSMYKYK